MLNNSIFYNKKWRSHSKNEISICFIINVDTNILARTEGIEPTSLVLETNIITIILSTHNIITVIQMLY